MQRKIQCPSCAKSVKVSDQDAGRQVWCPACGRRFDAPPPSLLAMLPADADSATPTARAAVPQAPLSVPQAPLSVPQAPLSVPQAAPVAEPEIIIGFRPEPGDERRRQLAEPEAPVGPAPGSYPAPGRPAAIQAAPPLGTMMPLFRMASPAVTPARVPLTPQPAPVARPWGRPGPVPAPAPSYEAGVPIAFLNVAAASPRNGALLPDLTPDPPQGDPSQGDPSQGDPSQSVPPLSKRTLHPIGWLALAVIGSVIAVVGILAATGQFNTWEADHKAALLALKGQAESLAIDDKPKEALKTYLEIEKEVAGRTLVDPQLKAAIDKAYEDKERIYKMLVTTPRAPGSVPATQAMRAMVAGSPASLRPLTSAPAAAGAETATSPPATSHPAPSLPAQASPPSAIAALINPTAASIPPGVAASPEAPGAVAPSVTTTPTRRPRVRTGTAPASPAMPYRDRPPLQPVDDLPTLTDERIGVAIQNGVNFLLARFDASTHTLRDESGEVSHATGVDALAVYALLQCGDAISDPRLGVRGPPMKAMIDALKHLSPTGSYETYARGIRATALALNNRPEDFPALKSDFEWLRDTCDQGAYTYTGTVVPGSAGRARLGVNGTEPRGAWDNSNSQYGLLGVWSAADADARIEVPASFWRAVQRHWVGCQTSNGMWGYHNANSNPTLSMTCAGLASLLVAHEYLDLSTGPNDAVGREPYSPALKKALEWFESGDHAVNTRGSSFEGYTLYGIERVGLASGFKFFGRHDWYRELAGQIIAEQGSSGSWRDDPIETSYALLFLSRGRHPILFNKLRYDGGWANRPRDVANLARYTSRQLERPLNWQIVNLSHPWTDWADSPILYVSGHTAPSFDADEVGKLNSFVEGGGMLFMNADAAAPAFDGFVKDLAKRMFPKYDLLDLPQDHPIYTTVLRPNPKPALKAVTNGARILLLYAPTDLAVHWQRREDRAYEDPGSHPSRPGELSLPSLVPSARTREGRPARALPTGAQRLCLCRRETRFAEPP